MADQQTVFRSVSSCPSKIKISFSNGKEPLIEDFGTPQWISELSTIVDEVRDRTILVKINSPLHSWSDSRISLLFSEIGVVEDVKHLPPGSGFNFQVRFQSTYDSEWAYCYFNGTFLHQGCCELEICRADDLVTWNIQRIVAIKVAFGIRNTLGTKNDDSLLEEVNQIEDTTEELRKNELDVVNKPSDFSAHQVLDKMPKSWLDEIAVINEELVDGSDLEAQPSGSVERLADVKTPVEGTPRDAIATTHALKLEISEQARMMNGVVNSVGFDPGGTDLSHGNLAIILPHGSLESEANEEKATVQITSNKAAVKEISYPDANHLFDKIPESSDCHPYKLLNECKVLSDDYPNQNEMKTLPTPGVVQLGHVTEKKVRHWSGEELIFLYKLLNPYIDKDNNFSSGAELTVLTNGLVGLASEEIFMSAYGLSIGDVARLDVICFDLRGAEFIFCVQIGQNVCCKLISLDPRGIKLNCHLHKLLGETKVFNGAYPYRDEVKNSILSRLADPQELELHLNCTMSEKYSNMHCFTELLKIRKLFGASLVGIIMKQSVLLALKCDGVKDMRSSRRSRIQSLVFKSDLFSSIICSEIFCFDPGGIILLPTVNSPKWCCSDMNLSIMMTCIKAHLLCKFSRVTFKMTRASLLAMDGLSIFKMTLGCCARNSETNEEVAIKKIDDAFNNRIDAKRTLREIKLLCHMDHDNVIKIKDIIKPPEKEQFNDVYIVYELMDTDLHQIIRSNQDLTDDHCQYFLYQILRGLKYIHSAHVLHRDLKPSSLLLNANCDVKICDFGLARTTSETDFMTEYVVTRWYRAPELLLNCSEYTAAIDIWSVGCIMMEIIRREPLFPGKDYVQQLGLINELLGSPEDSDLGFLRSDNAKRYVKQLPHVPKESFLQKFPNVSPVALDLAEKMLVFDPRKRITVEEALNHPYLCGLHEIIEPSMFSYGFADP